MDVTWKVTDADRDNEGKIKVASDEPRSLADLLPTGEHTKRETKRQTWTRSELAGLAVVVLIAVFVVIYAWAAPDAPTAPAQARPTLVATLAATSAPTVLPTAVPAALVGYFDYADPSTVAPITANQIARVVGQAGAWRLAIVGDARVWLAADQVPAGVPEDSPLPDLTPRTPAPQPVMAPVSAPAVCTRDIAPYVVTRQILFGTLPIGSATGFSCTSADAAEANAAAHEAEVRASYQATVTTKTSEAER